MSWQHNTSEFFIISERARFSSGTITQAEFHDGITLFQHRNNGRTRHQHWVLDRMYLHLVTLSATNQTVFKNSNGQAAAVGVDTGILRNPGIYLAYSWDSEFIRNGTSGSGLNITWIKSLWPGKEELTTINQKNKDIVSLWWSNWLHIPIWTAPRRQRYYH